MMLSDRGTVSRPLWALWRMVLADVRSKISSGDVVTSGAPTGELESRFRVI